jgi:hypothetical protein
VGARKSFPNKNQFPQKDHHDILDANKQRKQKKILNQARGSNRSHCEAIIGLANAEDEERQQVTSSKHEVIVKRKASD